MKSATPPTSTTQRRGFREGSAAPARRSSFSGGEGESGRASSCSSGDSDENGRAGRARSLRRKKWFGVVLLARPARCILATGEDSGALLPNLEGPCVYG